MKKYNYFDDEADEIEEVKKSSKIDLSAIINKFKKLKPPFTKKPKKILKWWRNFRFCAVQLLKDYGLQAQYL